MKELEYPITTTVAGVAHYQEPIMDLLLDQVLSLEREADNEYDKNAVMVLWGRAKVGYVPARLAKDLAWAIDRGYPKLKAKVVRINVSSKHPNAPVGVTIQIFEH